VATSPGSAQFCSRRERGKRTAWPGTTIKLVELRGAGPELKRARIEFHERLAKLTGQTLEEVAGHCRRETSFSAEEARDFGFIDAVVPRPQRAD
jgi:ATP-dependent protease ClpP protease subunit